MREPVQRRRLLQRAVHLLPSRATLGVTGGGSMKPVMNAKVGLVLSLALGACSLTMERGPGDDLVQRRWDVVVVPPAPRVRR